jgi:predicted MPP superfamily phosphohydrolase
VHDVSVPELPSELAGIRIAQVSDLHVGPGPWVPRCWREAAEAVRRSGCDIVVNTGDFLQWTPPPQKARAVFEQFLGAPHPEEDDPTTIAILGNHDYYAGEEVVDSLTIELRQEGVRVLSNEVLTLAHFGAPLTFAGLAIDVPGFEEALIALSGAPRPRVVLMHQPDEAAWLPCGIADLVLTGHTHGGQITLPFLEPFIVKHFCGSNYVAGWYRVNENPIYVNRGLGCTGLAVRVRARPEVSVFRLTH